MSGPAIESAILKLIDYCEANDWAGYDPYDALNSRLFAHLPFLNSRFPRLVLTQILKRSPIDVRRLMLIPATQNPKAIALFLSAFLKLSRIGHGDRQDRAGLMIERLIALRSGNTPYWCWGYSFPWQTRTILVPARAPNLVCTFFVANSLLDAYDERRDPRCLSMAVSAAEYLVNELYWTDSNGGGGFSYPLPSARVHVYNADLLAAALLCRVYAHTGDTKFLAPALTAARYSAAKQRSSGAWVYSESPKHQWIDNFHTGYNLCALRSVAQYAGTAEFDSCIRRGFEFYRANFFREDGAVRYFHDRTYPIDVHSVAQSVIALLTLRDLNPGNVSLAHSVFRWAMNHMWDDKGSFYYRVLRLCTIRTSYMRWSQAWMLLAMATLLNECRRDGMDEAGSWVVAVGRHAHD